MKKLTNLEKLLKEIDNVGQLSADMRYKVNNDNLDLQVEIESIRELLKNIERHTKKRESKRRERLCRIGLLIK